MDARMWGQDTAVAREHHRAPRRRFLALAAALLAATALFAWPVPTADAARIICVWDDNQKKWVCTEEGRTGAVTPDQDAIAARIVCVWDEIQKKWVCKEAEGSVGA